MFNDAPDGHDRSDEPVSSTPRAASAPRAAGQLIGRSPELLSVLSLMERVAPSSCTVLITGESGTGKEVLVAALHEQSPRRAAPLVTINCGAIPEQLLESELFGHARGAFTGAHASRPGRVQAAEGGTLFLDEVGELPLGLQVKLLRLLQQREYSPVGDNRTIKCDIRVVAATNRDLAKEVAEGRFREDLYYRLDVIHLELPPLRERPGDVALLAEHFLGVCAERAGRSDLLGFSPEALALLEVYEWPGNVRALENAVERAVLLSAGPLIAVADLPPAIRASARKAAPAHAPAALDADLGLREAVERFENQLIMQALERTGWNKQRAAQLLRDPRTGNEHPVEPRLLDSVYRIARKFAAHEIRVVSGYRTPKPGTHSNHGRGRAMDLIVPGTTDEDVAKFAREAGFAGVGIYPVSGFVHVDVRTRSFYWVDRSSPGRTASRRRSRRRRGHGLQEVHGTQAQQADARARALGVAPLGGTEAPAAAAAEPDDEDDEEQSAAPQVATSGG